MLAISLSLPNHTSLSLTSISSFSSPDRSMLEVLLRWEEVEELW